ncbi:MAG TPA: VWA domain-containing protein [Candidatus Binatia bacterium]|nr:VWA domain-containing protein [Candidatus Binatia bacterium]
MSAYTSAVARAQPSERLIELERFAVHAQPGPLKIDALEIVVWEYLRAHDTVHALVWARDLADSDSDNAVALALLSNEGRGAMEQGRMKAERLLRMASHGLDNLPQLRRPLGMSESDFTLLRRQTNAMLSGAAGAAELRSKDYIAARDYLHNAVAVEPDNARWDYELALADLNGSDPNRKEGYWYLARAVNLSRGTPQAVEIARYARARYVKDGGSTGDWDQFLVAAAPAPSSGTRPPSSAVASNLPSLPHPPAETPPPVKTAAIKTAPPVKTASIRTPAISQPKQPAPSIWADTSNPPVVQKRRVPSTTGPMSLGILVETSLAHRANRSAVVNSLIDMLRHMDQRDEAFILSYDNNLVFQQDLTTDPQQLEQAMESIRPQKGAVLDDAIAFAAGHLARIAKYPNRVLLVISDGRNVDSHASPLQTSAEINAAGVRIYCIGVEVSDLEGRYRLQALAAGTGGQSNFISDTGQFRKATEQMAQNMGIDFRF